MANCLLHLSIADDGLSKLCMALEILANNYCCVLWYLQIVPSQHYGQDDPAFVHYRAETWKTIWTKAISYCKIKQTTIGNTNQQSRLSRSGCGWIVTHISFLSSCQLHSAQVKNTISMTWKTANVWVNLKNNRQHGIMFATTLSLVSGINALIIVSALFSMDTPSMWVTRTTAHMSLSQVRHLVLETEKKIHFCSELVCKSCHFTTLADSTLCQCHRQGWIQFEQKGPSSYTICFYIELSTSFQWPVMDGWYELTAKLRQLAKKKKKKLTRYEVLWSYTLGTQKMVTWLNGYVHFNQFIFTKC